MEPNLTSQVTVSRKCPEDNEMTAWLNLQRLPKNDLKAPFFATSNSAGIDFSACLRRPCYKMDIKEHETQKREFYLDERGNRLSSSPEIEEPILILKPNEIILVPLGYKCEFSDGYALKLYIRSSLGIKGIMLANNVGIIDADYRGELFACLINLSGVDFKIVHGERIVQAIMSHCIQPIIKEISVVNSTLRGEGGFGSTGK